MEERALNRSGAWNCSSLISIDQLKLTIWESGILLKPELFSGVFQQILLHSLLIESMNKEKSDSCTSSKAIVAFAIDEA